MIYNVYVPKKVVLPDTFSQATWDEIVYACQKSKVPETWAVGDSKVVYDKYDGVFFTADIIGKAHDDYADGSGKAPLTFMTHDLYGELWTMNDTATNVGGWASCRVRTERLPEVLESFPDPIKGAVRKVTKVTGTGGGSDETTTTNDKLFLASSIEALGGNAYAANDEGTLYDGFSTRASRIKHLGGQSYVWWTRSPCIENDTSFAEITVRGTVWYANADSQHGVAFAFCL